MPLFDRLWMHAPELVPTDGMPLRREIFGNPFRPVSADSPRQTGVTLTLAGSIYENLDFGAMPILADALEEAGCEDAGVLEHCRDPKGVHVRGCWVVDLVLGKS